MAPKPQEHIEVDAAGIIGIQSAEEEERQRVEDAKNAVLTHQSGGSSIGINDSSSPTSSKTTATTTIEDKVPSEECPPADATESVSRYYYLTPKSAAAIPNFQYSGADLSLIYKHVLSPLAQYLVDHWTPTWAAPNTITLFGLCWMVASYGLIWYHCPDTMDEALVNDTNDAEGGGTAAAFPRWIFGFNCAAMLIYQTLDNMDGKQSRKTNSSSPMGLLFDHGCDAINSIFGSANWICAMGMCTVTDQWQIYALVLAPMAAFYVTTWEEYHTHELILPVFNGPTEGLLMGAGLFATSALYGAQYWHTHTWFEAFVGPYVVPYLPSSVSDLIPSGGMRNCDVVAVVTLLALAREAAEKMFHVARRYGVSSLGGLFPMAFLFVASFLVGYADPTILVRHPRACLHLIAALFVESVTQLMLDHMTTMRFRSVRPAQVPLAVYAALVWTGAVEGRMADDLLMAYAAAMCVYLAMKFAVIIHELCDVLGIWCFDIVTPHPMAAAAAMKKRKKD